MQNTLVNPFKLIVSVFMTAHSGSESELGYSFLTHQKQEFVEILQETLYNIYSLLFQS